MVIGAIVLGSCTDGDGGTDPTAAPGSISGTVARQKTGEGVDGAVLALLADSITVRAVTVSDANGRFAFEDVEQGEYRVRLIAPALAGLDPLYYALEPEEFTVSVASDPLEVVLAVVGIVPARVTGTVLCGGAPAVGVEVRVIGGSADVVGATDSGGFFTVLDLLPGTYAVIPVSAPCDLEPRYQAVHLRPGEFKVMDFGG